METGVAAEEFITIVPVGEGKPAVKDPAFVTVLTVGAATGAAEVAVCRPRGARLGLGLKFEGGSAAAENVRRLLVQSCAEDSPAANATTPWGKLIPGDEILAIDGVSVSELTRIDCVRRLKDSDEKLTLLVRHFELEDKVTQNNMDSTESDTAPKQNTEISRPTTLPPPVPPRKLGKKNSFKDKPTLQTVGEQNTLNHIDGHKLLQNDKETVIPTISKLSRKSSFDSHIHRQSKEGIAYLKKGSPEEVRRLVRRLSDGKNMPPDAEVYIDLLSNEWERCLVFADAESDDTGSSISTVVDRLGSMASSVENSIPSTPIMPQKSIDIQKVLNCIENIDTNILKDMTSAKFLERQMDINNECKKLEKSSTTNGFTNHEAVIQNTLSEEQIIQAKKVQSNDKNNNHTPIQNNTQKLETNETSQINDKVITKEIGCDKPKPMPRNTKIERTTSEKKRRPIPIPEPLAPPVAEPLLTPTKKNCIETWLQRSEAEMNNKLQDDKFEEVSMPEILPRLIDFVPKSQFKESTETPTCTRPTAPPPPPPAEPREDGSGASLDTIGELDESTDVTDNAKRTPETEIVKRKSSFERTFWDDRVNKSDAEDKSLSNDETPLPTCPRQPPDGVETPSEAIEKTPDLPTRLPPRLPTGWPNTRPRFSYISRTQDARSEASVKDKIAMFSTDIAVSSDRLDKCGTLPTRTHSTLRKSSTPYINTYSEVSSLDRRLTKSQDNLDEMPRSYKRHSERPEVLGATEHIVTDTKAERYVKSDIMNKPLFYGSTTTLPSAIDSSFARATYHARSVSDDNSNKNISTHKSNLEYLIEQRKKSMSKLRGLVIPEVHAPIVDLPEIKVQDSLSKSFLQKLNHNNINKKESKSNNSAKPIVLNDIKWKSTFLPNNIPKYSPAFKRKSLQVYSPSSLSKESTPERKLADKTDTLNKINKKTSLTPSVRSSLDTSKSLLSNTNIMKEYNKKVLSDIHEYKNVEIKICTATDIIDSDNDSAMSSTQSYRSSASSPMQNIENVESDNSRLSPRVSHYATYSRIKTDIPTKSSTIEKHSEEYVKRNVCRSVSSDTNISLSSSAGSAATSGSQASCSSLESSVTDSDKRKVSRTYNIDTINRRNILASAKCRSGRDLKLKSPVVETKFSHESYDRSPSPTHKTSERLSTLTSSVSAVANKGENRRRNKVIADSDSDSDTEVNIRQRKTDYKNTRLKRNLSNSNKNKQNDSQNRTEPDSVKVEDAPNFIKEKIIKEIKKAGLDTFNSYNNKSSLTEKTNIEHKRTDNVTTSKKDFNSNIENTRRKDSITLDNSKPVLNIKAQNTVLVNDKKDKKSVQDVQLSTQFIKLKRGSSTSVGLILAGGIDCEAKDVTVHRVLADSIAAKAGLKRGAKIRSINGSTMLGLTHAQSVTILKEQRSEVVIEIVDENPENVSVKQCGSETAESKDCHVEEIKIKRDNKAASSIVTVLLEKAGGGAGLGFGLDGGRDSPHGDRPLTIKKLFAGGAAAQSGRVLVGAELLSAGGQSMEGLTRTQAWSALKALPAGQVALVLRNPKHNE
ncbi:uncharacterized protein bbg [Epargyreus clarus]|uniref:uncharacterized protein bbg n=1 Tax=Epargyreus clarus TaxID=520877 RepID=UPI003C303BD6